MKYPDYHLHTEFSGDCRTPIRDLIASAKEKGLSEICITDHYDHDFPEGIAECSFNLDFDAYFQTLGALKQELAPDFTLKIGIEQGLMPSTCEAMSDFSLRYPMLDFIICSTHVVDGFDPYYPHFFEKWGEKPGYRRYFEEILYTVEHFHDYNVYGHLDYILRYGPTKAEHFDIKEYMDVFEAILKTIIRNGKGIELNTGSLYRGMDFAHPHPARSSPLAVMRMTQSMWAMSLKQGQSCSALSGSDTSVPLRKGSLSSSHFPDRNAEKPVSYNGITKKAESSVATGTALLSFSHLIS